MADESFGKRETRSPNEGFTFRLNYAALFARRCRMGAGNFAVAEFSSFYGKFNARDAR